MIPKKTKITKSHTGKSKFIKSQSLHGQFPDFNPFFDL